MVEHWFFVAFNIIISHIFPENFTEICQIVQKIWRLSLPILAIFINFHQFFDFSRFPSYKETSETSLQQMMAAFFHFQLYLDSLAIA